jgi:quercetin dioxygenase-like cupin family protein
MLIAVLSGCGGAIRGMLLSFGLSSRLTMNAAVRRAVLLFACLLALSAGYALGQQSPPTDYKLVREEVLAGIDLAKEIDSVQDCELRLSRAIIEPGGHVGLHSHLGDPTIVYMLSGALTNHHDDGTIEEFRPGQSFSEFGPRAHWVENQGSVPVIFIVANIHSKE